MSDTSMTGKERIELSEEQRERFDRIKAECTNDHLPEPTDKQIMKSLMDTWDAVGDGFYSDSDPGELSPEQAAFGHVRRSRDTGGGRNE